MPTPTRERVQISVRLDKRIADLLDAKVAHEKSIGHKVTKEKVVADAIVQTCGDEQPKHGWLPVMDGEWIAPIDLTSNVALLDFLDETEAEEKSQA